MNGIINVNKPSGCTSQYVVSKIRKILNTRAVGHMGTLDPQGEGVLLVGVGKSTRLFDVLLRKDKVYVARFKFGYETDTLDKDGTLIKSTDNIPTFENILEATKKQIGKIEQLPPKYSAKNINGERAYDLARKGVEFELKPSCIEVFSIDVNQTDEENAYDFCIHCSSGTYIRSICRDIAYSLDSLATMTSIVRTKSGNFFIEDAHSLEDIEKLKESAIIPVQNAISFLPKVEFADEKYIQLCHGIKFETDLDIVEPFAVYCKNELFGVAIIENNRLIIKTYLRD